MSLIWVLLQKQGNGEDQKVQLPSIPDALQGLYLSVSNIDHESHFIFVSLTDPEGCLARLFLQRRLYNSSIIYPFEYANENEDIVTFFNCSSAGSIYHSSSCPIRALGSQESVLPRYDNLAFCSMISRLRSPVPAYYFQLDLKWKFQPKVENHHKTRIILSSTGSIALLFLLVVCFYICRYFKHKGEDQVRLETFLKDYQALKPTRFSYADIKRITHKFKDKLGEGAHGTVFKGKLSTEIQVAVKVLNNSDYDGKDFINEMGTMGKIHHINVVRMLGFCADGCRRALVYDFFSNGSLEKFISSPDNKEIFLGWSKLQQIALDIAKGIEYLHQGCDYRILHFDINPRNVLLDSNFTPKISDFGLAKLCSKDQREVDKLKVPPTPFDFTTSTNINTVIPIRHLNLELDVTHELE
ncbi:hypothetical protein K1719_044300 [Acacia pycnantha]|nr:hypothetical protein K1719_044300 [Acacia pycnantha]